jgi:hypothetical protein
METSDGEDEVPYNAGTNPPVSGPKLVRSKCCSGLMGDGVHGQ